jgi:hypothetical protein
VAGMNILKFIMLSCGVGEQFNNLRANQREMLQYFSGTIGLSIELGTVNRVIDENMKNGKDLKVNVLRASTGFWLSFNSF